MARMHEACKYYKLAQKWLSEIDLHGKFYTKPEELTSLAKVLGRPKPPADHFLTGL